jgi:hypothetical protein
MKPETQAFLDRVREAEDPTLEDERRVLQAVRGAVVTGSPGKTFRSSQLGRRHSPFTASWLRLGGVAACLAAGGALAFGLASSRSPSSPPAPDSPQGGAAVPPGAVIRAPAVVSSAPEPPRSAEVGSRPLSPPPKSASTAALPPRPLERELAFLAEVQAALKRGDAAEALRRLDGHRTDDTEFMAERRAARVLALCAVGSDEQARQALAEFLRAHPTSPQRAAVEGSCAGRAQGR